jgi:hypothetical protein
VRLRTRSDRPTCRREIEKPGERDAEEQASASRSSRTRFSLVAVDEAVVLVAFRLFRDNNWARRLSWGRCVAQLRNSCTRCANASGSRIGR